MTLYLQFLPLSTPDLGRDPLVSGKQVVEIKHTLKEPRSLADPVRTTGHTRELHLRDVCWKQANGELRKISPLLHVFCYVYEILGQIALRTGYVNYIHAPNIVHFPLSKPTTTVLGPLSPCERDYCLLFFTSSSPACEKTTCRHCGSV